MVSILRNNIKKGNSHKPFKIGYRIDYLANSLLKGICLKWCMSKYVWFLDPIKEALLVHLFIDN